jgi:hypothetical protein
LRVAGAIRYDAFWDAWNGRGISWDEWRRYQAIKDPHSKAEAAWRAGNKEARTQVTPVLRDLFGNPFRFVSVAPAWLVWEEGAVPKIAQSIYTERAFDRLPILADALEDAGCTDPEILGHCRQRGEHACGCWAVDLILGKR